MATQYPGTLDSFATSAGTSLLTSPDHSDRHNTEGSAIIAVETLLGTASGSNYLGTVKAVSTQLGTYVVNATPTANNILVADAVAAIPIAAANGAWVYPNHTWVYNSASQFKITGLDVRSFYKKGMPVRWKQGAGYLYGNISADSTLSGSDTVFSIIVNTDFVIANSAITDNYISYSPTPYGFPQYFNFSSTTTPNGGGGFTPAFSAVRYRMIVNEVRISWVTVGHTVSGTISSIDFALPATENTGLAAGANVCIAGFDFVGGGSKVVLTGQNQTTTTFRVSPLSGNFQTTSANGYMGFQYIYQI
jgi:hypothetical protein